jgi:hypothetical protein
MKEKHVKQIRRGFFLAQRGYTPLKSDKRLVWEAYKRRREFLHVKAIETAYEALRQAEEEEFFEESFYEIASSLGEPLDDGERDW